MNVCLPELRLCMKCMFCHLFFPSTNEPQSDFVTICWCENFTVSIFDFVKSVLPHLYLVWFMLRNFFNSGYTNIFILRLYSYISKHAKVQTEVIRTTRSHSWTFCLVFVLQQALRIIGGRFWSTTDMVSSRRHGDFVGFLGSFVYSCLPSTLRVTLLRKNGRRKNKQI